MKTITPWMGFGIGGAAYDSYGLLTSHGLLSPCLYSIGVFAYVTIFHFSHLTARRSRA